MSATRFNDVITRLGEHLEGLRPKPLFDARSLSELEALSGRRPEAVTTLWLLLLQRAEGELLCSLCNDRRDPVVVVVVYSEIPLQELQSLHETHDTIYSDARQSVTFRP